MLKPHEERVGQGRLKQREKSFPQSCSFTPPQLFCSRVFPSTFPGSPLRTGKPWSHGSQACYSTATSPCSYGKSPPRGLLHLFHLSPFHLPPCPQGNTAQADKLMRQLALCSLIEGPFISLTSQANSQHRWVLDFISAMWFIFPLAHI